MYKSKIGLFFGSFNPVHNGHLIIASYVANFFVDMVWFIVSPQNPLKQKTDLLNVYARVELADQAVQNDSRFKVSNIEIKLPIPSYTIDTIDFLKQKNSDYEYFIILGSDSFINISLWKSYERLLSENNFLIYQRPGYIIEDLNSANIRLLNAPLINISSTEIRSLIKQQKNIRYLVPEAVVESIQKNKYYI